MNITFMKVTILSFLLCIILLWLSGLKKFEGRIYSKFSNYFCVLFGAVFLLTLPVHFLFILKEGPVFWLHEWKKLDISGALLELFSEKYLVLLLKFLTILSFIAFAISFVPILSCIAGTVKGFIFGYFQFGFPSTTHITFQHDKWLDELKHNAFEWFSIHLFLAIVYTVAYLILLIAIYSIKFSLSREFLGSYLYKYGWIAPLFFLCNGLIALIVYKIKKRFY